MRADGNFAQADLTRREMTARRTVETDSLGHRELRAEALYGFNTPAAVESSPLSGRTIASLPEDTIGAVLQIAEACARESARQRAPNRS